MKQHAPQFLAVVNDARTRIAETTVQHIKERRDNGEKFYLVDVREDNEWQKGHIPGAIHIGKGVIERDIEAIIPDTTADIVLYCGGGYRSALSADMLQKMGYTSVISMDGGYRGWCDARLPIEQ